MAEPLRSALGVTVAPGSGSDVCPLCGIHRENAGFLKETCGENYTKPGCFIVDECNREGCSNRATPGYLLCAECAAKNGNQ